MCIRHVRPEIRDLNRVKYFIKTAKCFDTTFLKAARCTGSRPNLSIEASLLTL